MRQLLGNFDTGSSAPRYVPKTQPGQSRIAWQAVCDNRRAFGDVIAGKLFQAFSRCGFDPSNTKLSGKSAFRLNGANDKRLNGSASTLASFCSSHSSGTDVSLIHFDNSGYFCALRTDHSSAETLQHHVSGFIMNADLFREIPRRQTSLLRGDKVGSPKPFLKRDVAGVHHGISRDANLVSFLTLPNATSARESDGLRSVIGTDKTFRPTNAAKIIPASVFSRKPSLKFKDIEREFHLSIIVSYNYESTR